MPGEEVDSQNVRTSSRGRNLKKPTKYENVDDGPRRAIHSSLPSPGRDVANNESTICNSKSDPVCELCNTSGNEDSVKIVMCRRCKLSYCIKCLNQDESVYKLASKNIIMWFCPPCKGPAEKCIDIESEIELRCNDLVKSFESTVSELELKLESKCNELQVREIVREELDSNQDIMLGKIDKITSDLNKLQSIQASTSEELAAIPKVSVTEAATNSVENRKDREEEFLQEVDERKSRESNIVIFNMTEIIETDKESRLVKDKDEVKELLRMCDLEDENIIIKMFRIGRYTQDKTRPILVGLQHIDDKQTLFQGVHKLKHVNKFENVRIVNDLTKLVYSTYSDKQAYN